MNREQKRAALKKQPKQMRGLTRTQRINALIKNGITPEDLTNSYKEGFNEGFHTAAPAITKTLYAAVILAARAQFRFGRKRCMRLIRAVDQEVLNTLTSEEAIDKVFQQIGVQINFGDPIDPIVEVG